MPSDDFNRADNATLGANWALLAGDLDLVSNHAENPNVTQGLAEWVGGGDQQSRPTGAQVDAGLAADGRGGVFIMKSGAITAVTLRDAKKRAVIGDDRVDAHTWNAADWTSTSSSVKTKVADIAVAFAGAGTIRIEKSGTTITYKYNGAVIGTFNDTGGPTSGTSGIFCRQLASTIDNFAVDAPGAAPPDPEVPAIAEMDLTAFPQPPTPRPPE